MRANELIMTANLGCVKCYRIDFPVGRTPFPQLLEEITLVEAHERQQDIASDATGRFHTQPSEGFVSETGERTGLESEIQNRLVRTLIRHIQASLARYNPRSWKLAASREINASIVKGIGMPWGARLAQNIEQNLAHLPAQKLLAHFRIHEG